jgi:hypothetical protein
MDSTFLKDIRVSLRTDPLALKFKNQYENPRSRDHSHVQVQETVNSNSQISDPASPDTLLPSSRIHRSHEGEMLQDDTDPRFQFRDRLLYYQELLYVPDGLCRL